MSNDNILDMLQEFQTYLFMDFVIESGTRFVDVTHYKRVTRIWRDEGGGGVEQWRKVQTSRSSRGMLAQENEKNSLAIALRHVEIVLSTSNFEQLLFSWTTFEQLLAKLKVFSTRELTI